MGWSFKIAKIMGIEVKVHVTFLLLLGFFGMVYYSKGGVPAAVTGLALILLLFACVLLHEFGHAIAAKHYGIRTPDITLLPIGGLARLERMPEKPWQEFVVAIAGPLVNVAIALGLLVVMGGRGDLSGVSHMGSGRVDLLNTLFGVNVMLVLFNLIPAFPMDGGRVLRALLATRLNYSRATQIAANVGQAMAFVFGFWGLLNGQPMLVLIAVFVYLGASQEAASAQLRDVSKGMPVSEAMITNFTTLPDYATLDDAIDALRRTSQHDFPIVNIPGEVVGILTRADILKALREGGTNVPVQRVMRTGIPSVHAGAMFDEAFRTMQECNCPVLPVLDSSEKLVGIITPENVGEMMMIHAALSANSGKNPAPPWRHPVNPGT